MGFSYLFDGGFGVLGSMVFFFFSCCDWCLKEEVGMAELGTGLIWMVAELALERKNQGFFQVAARHILVGGCSGFGLVVGG